MDRISNLPIDLKHIVLCNLSIKEAVRTTVLSRSWKHSCDTLPHLVFDDQCCVSYQKDETTKRKRETQFYHIVDQVLSLQENNTSIVTFKLSHRNEHVDSMHIDRWIRHLSRTSVRLVVLEQWRKPLYHVSSRLFSCRDLEYLKLWGSSLKIPSSFMVFGKLKSLYIQKSTIEEGALEKLISCCPLLADLIVHNCDGIAHLSIDAPNLECLEIDGAVEDLSIKNSLNLEYVSIIQRKASGSFSNLLGYFIQLRRLKSLKIHGYLLLSAVDSLKEELLKPNLCLESLCLCICMTSMDEILAAIRLLTSSHALQILELSLWQRDVAAFAPGGTTHWLSDNQNWDKLSQLKKLKVTNFAAGARNEVDFIKYLLLSSPDLRELEIEAQEPDPAIETSKSLLDDFRKLKFTQLQVVKLSGISGVESEVDLIKFLLRFSPRLQKMTIQPGSIRSVLEREVFFIKLLNLRRASKRAVIEYLDPMTESVSESESEDEFESESVSDSDSD